MMQALNKGDKSMVDNLTFLDGAKLVRTYQNGTLVMVWHGGTTINVYHQMHDGSIEPTTCYNISDKNGEPLSANKVEEPMNETYVNQFIVSKGEIGVYETWDLYIDGDLQPVFVESVNVSHAGDGYDVAHYNSNQGHITTETVTATDVIQTVGKQH